MNTTTEINLQSAHPAVDPDQVARVMGSGYAEMPGEFQEVIQAELDFLRRNTGFRAGYRRMEGIQWHKKDRTFLAEGLVFHPGKTVYRFLDEAPSLVFYLCTAGEEISGRSGKYMAEGMPMEAYVADVVGSLAVEAIADLLFDTIKEDVSREGFQMTNRYSPGYCDWEIAEQHALFSLLPDQFCGISLNASTLMHPVKSVSGVAGIGKGVKHRGSVCRACPNRDCPYRDETYPSTPT